MEDLFHFAGQLTACQRLKRPIILVEVALYEDADQNTLHCGSVLPVKLSLLLHKLKSALNGDLTVTNRLLVRLHQCHPLDAVSF